MSTNTGTTSTPTPASVAPSFHAVYESRVTTAAAAAAQIASGSTIAMGLSPCQPPALLRALADRVLAGEVADLKVYYSVSGRHLRNTLLRFELLRQVQPFCLFFGATERELAARGRAEGRRRVVHYVPNFFFELDRLIAEHGPVDTFMTTVAPMDSDGYFSFGTNSDYSCQLSRRCGRIVVEVNHHMPRVHGPAKVHVSEVAGIVEHDERLESFPVPPPKELDPLVARNVVDLIADGATLQMGIGSLPGTVCDFLTGHKDLGIHTELFTPPMATLMERGVVTNARKKLDAGKTVFTFALGDRPMYEFMHEHAGIEGRPVSYVNDPRIIAQQDRFVSINSTLEIDLTGQCNSEQLNGYQYSGAGGQVDFVRGAFASREGKSVMVLASVAADGAVSRIVPPLHGPVTTSRMDVHWVVTEHGAVCLKGKSEWERTDALISIAAPQFREELRFQAAHMR